MIVTFIWAPLLLYLSAHRKLHFDDLFKTLLMVHVSLGSTCSCASCIMWLAPVSVSTRSGPAAVLITTWSRLQHCCALFNCAIFVVTVGPCALEYTKMKTADHFWTDPSADELVQRHRIHGGHCRQDSPTKRPTLCVSTTAGNSAD